MATQVIFLNDQGEEIGGEIVEEITDSYPPEFFIHAEVPPWYRLYSHRHATHILCHPPFLARSRAGTSIDWTIALTYDIEGGR